MNKLDTSLVTAALKQAGFELSENGQGYDVVLFNTCSVREHAEKKVFSHLGQLQHEKQTKPELIVAVMGCMAQRLGDELLEYEAVDIVCGPGQIPQLPKMLTEAMEQRAKRIAVSDNPRGQVETAQSAELEDFETVFDHEDKNIPGQAFVRAMRGCDNFCSYCIVPYVRGPEVSRPVNAILEQIRRLADEGVKQVTLLGQTVNSYNYNDGGRSYSLADLLDKVSQIDGIEWIKFVTNYPLERGYGDLLAAMRDLPKVCEYLHIPAQSGSDRILKAMNRKYTRGQYLDMIAKAKETVPGINIAGDFIVGFPGETEKDFQDTISLIERARYRNCFVFKYSPRPGTKGEKRLMDDVPENIKKQRNNRLLAVQEKISGELAKGFVGKKIRVLVEGLSKKPHLNNSNGRQMPQLLGRTAGDWIVVFNGPKQLEGQFADVRITKAKPLTLFGELQKPCES